MAELEAKAANTAPKSRIAPGSEPTPSWSDRMKSGGMNLASGFMSGGIPGLAAAGVGEAMKTVGDYTNKAAYNVGGATTDLLAPYVPPEVAGGAGYAANVATQAIPVILGSQASKITSPGFKAAGQRLMKSAVKPLAADVESGAAPRAITTMLDEGINATQGGMDKLHGITRALDKEVQGAIAASPERVGVAEVGQYLRKPYEAARSQVNPSADMDAVRGVWDQFRTHPDLAGKTDMPVQLAQALKRGTYRALGEKSYGELATSKTEAQKALARGLREKVAEKVPEVVAPLKREASLMNVLSVAERKALMEANKNPMGLALLAKNPYAMAGFMADKSALFKSLLARMLYSGSEVIPQTAGAVAGGYAGMRSGTDQ